jgi:hypothetical protein
MKHSIQDEISLELARRVVNRLREDPGLLQIARDNLANWTRRNAAAPSLLRCYQEWQTVLSRSLDEICDTLSADTEEAARLRQNSPFAGVLAPVEVWEIKREVRRRAKSAA